MTERVALYCRVSTDEQAERQTIQNQLASCREYAARQGWEIAEEFRDEGVSGSVPFDQRPEGSRLLALARQGVFSRAVVLCVDRLSRNLVDAAVLRKEFDRLGIALEFVHQRFDDSPEGDLMYHQFAAFGEYEKAVIARGTSQGRKRSVRNGRYLSGGVPYGYLRVDGNLAPHPEQAEVVRYIFQLAQEGFGLHRIAQRLEAEGVPSAKKEKWGWHFGQVRRILTHPRYTGLTTYGGEPMQCPPLIAPETFAAVQEGLRARRRDSAGALKHMYLLPKLVYCRACGSRYTVRTMTTGKADYRCYQKAVYGDKDTQHEGVKWRWRAAELEPLVTEQVRALALDPRAAVADVQVQVREMRREFSQEGDRVAFLERRLAELEAEEREVLRAHRKRLIDDKQMAASLQEVRAEVWSVHAQLDDARQVASQADTLEQAAQWFEALYASAEVAPYFTDECGRPTEPSPEEWRALIAQVVGRIWIERDGTVTLDPPETANVLSATTCR